MNSVPTKFDRLDMNRLITFTQQAFQKVGTNERDASLMAKLLVETDLRGVFSHGTRQLDGYIQMMIDQKVNPRPNIQIEVSGQTTAVFDGDGGMGHLPSYQAAQFVVEAAKSSGIAGAVTRNHFHFGAAGKYSRLALEQDCIGFATSAHRFRPSKDHSILSASGASPISFAIPAGKQPPIVVDMGAYLGGSGKLSQDQLFKYIPATFFKFIGLGAAAHMMGGFMAGIWMSDPEVNQNAWEGANQGAFICAIDISRFRDLEHFKQEVDRHQKDIQQMIPAPGYDQANLPGTLEYQREKEWAQIGIPIGVDHQSILNVVANKIGLEPLFSN